jgi:hypothetical protein
MLVDTYIYKNYIKNLHDTFVKRLDDISTQYNFDLGSEFEVAICEVLSCFLPNKYGICRGFAVTAEGAIAGDDIIIYDKERFPTLRTATNRAFDKKDMVPIEAIYAYIEAKHTLDADSFVKSVEQVQKVKQLCSRRESVGIYQADPYISEDKFSPSPSLTWPAHRNPVFGMILCRYSAGVDGKVRACNSTEVDSFIRGQLEGMIHNEYAPDLIAAGADNFLSPAHLDKDGKNIPSLHYIPGITTGYQVLEKPDVSFGAALAQLAGAIDWARLGRMPWPRIVNDARFPESKKI